jgi:hypothetical protein
MLQATYGRRAVIRLLGLGIGSAILAACTPDGRGGSPGAVASRSPTTSRITSPSPTPDSAATKLVADVVDFRLRGPFEWNGGSVTMRLHGALVDGERAYFVRTDAADAAFAKQEGLVHVPLLAAAGSLDGGTADFYLFDEGAPDQLPILSSAPGMDGFTPLFRIHRVRAATGTPFEAAHALKAAADAGQVEIERSDVIVNYPFVKWPGGELSVDHEVKLPLANGPLLSAPDLDAMTVTFKLHQCFPESRYIVTDTSAVPMAPMMSIAGSPGTQGLIEAGATSKITVFGNGIPGPGAMGFQPAIFQAKAGNPAWSPMWDHWTAVWKDADAARLLTSQSELDEAAAAGEIELHHGTPDTGGMGFVVNCPSPIVAPNDFEVT